MNPSDLGFHNAIKSNNKIYLIDFEYFGKDDPVKLVSDFIWHPGNNLSINFKKKWKETMFKEFNNDKQFFLRFEASFLLYGMRFILIILNCFNQDFVDKISKVKNLNKTNQLLFLQKTRISKAYKIYKNINKQLN